MATKELKVGQKAPEFTLKNQDESPVHLSDYRGKWVVLYFYPRDNTPGCTIEANDFTKLAKDFNTLEGTILGVSPDSCASHVKFIKGQNLRIALLSDEEKKAARAYGVWQKKTFMGKSFMGVVRSTFLIDPEGKIAWAGYGIKADGHATAVLAKLKELQKHPVSV